MFIIGGVFVTINNYYKDWMTGNYSSLVAINYQQPNQLTKPQILGRKITAGNLMQTLSKHSEYLRYVLLKTKFHTKWLIIAYWPMTYYSNTIYFYLSLK